jgi:hypothetical protein
MAKFGEGPKEDRFEAPGAEMKAGEDVMKKVRGHKIISNQRALAKKIGKKMFSRHPVSRQGF